MKKSSKQRPRKRGGVVEYLWQHYDNPNEIIPKISYVFLYKPWGWIIGSGLYYDDVEVEIVKLTRTLTLVGFGVFILVTILSGYNAWRGILATREKQRMLASLKSSEAKFRGISSSAHDGIIMITPEGTVSYWNSAAEKIFGYHPDEIIGKNLHKILAPLEQYQKFLSTVERFKQTGTGDAIGNTLEFQAIHKNGHEIPTELSVSALNIEDEWHAVGIVRDVTEKKKAGSALQESETKYRTLFDSTNDMILLMDDMVIVDCNSRAPGFFQTDKANIIGKTLVDFSPEFQIDGVPSKAAAQQYINKAKKNEPQHFEWIHQNFGDESINSDVILKKITILGKELLLAVCRDLTDRKQSEEALRMSTALLRAAERIAKVGGWSADFITQTNTWSDGVAIIHEKEPGYSHPNGWNG